MQHAYPAALAFITLCEVWSLCWPIAAIAANRYTVAQHRAPQCAPHHTALILIFGLRVKTACIFLCGARVSVRTLETEREKSHEKIGKSTKKLVTTSSYAWYKSQSRFFVCLFRCVELPANESEPTISRSFAIYAVSGKRTTSINCRSAHIFFLPFYERENRTDDRLALSTLSVANDTFIIFNCIYHRHWCIDAYGECRLQFRFKNVFNYSNRRHRSFY